MGDALFFVALWNRDRSGRSPVNAAMVREPGSRLRGDPCGGFATAVGVFTGNTLLRRNALVHGDFACAGFGNYATPNAHIAAHRDLAAAG